MASFTFQKEVRPEFRHRLRLVMTVVSIVFLLLVGRLWFLQVFQGERFSHVAKNNRIRLKKVPGARGMIFDRKGELLVDTRPSFDLLFVPEDSAEPEVTLRHLARLLGRDEGRLLDTLEDKGRRVFEETVLGRDLDWRTVAVLEAHQLGLPGVALRIRPRRSYLTNGTAAHLLGYTGEIGTKELQALKETGYNPGDEMGQFGLEKSLEAFLRGRSGRQQVEVDALGRRVGVLRQVEAVPGYNVRLTVDREVQETAYEALEGKNGAIVVLNARNGAILALVSSPAFDPNLFARGISTDEWRGIVEDGMQPLNNRAIQGQYPPGSTFKIVLAIAALEEGLIQPETRIFDPGYLVVGNRQFRDWKKGGHGWVNLHKAIVESCNVYFYELGMRLGVDRIARYARALGLGQKTGIALDGEKSGLIPNSEWKRRHFGEPWLPGETPSVAIGQGYVNVTPLQMANLIGAVANGGTLYRPWAVRRVESFDGILIDEYAPEKLRSLTLKESTLRSIHDALRDAVNSGPGTGGRARSNLVEIAGKTGTAQVAEMRGGFVKGEQLDYSMRDHAWFVAYAPAENPEIAVAVLVEHGGRGGSASARLAKTVIEKYFTLKSAPLHDMRPGSGKDSEKVKAWVTSPTFVGTRP